MVGLCFQINDWTLSVDENKLYRQDREVSVEPRLINLLSFLATHAEEVFCREELIERVWDGAIVTDQVVTQSIFELRKILRDGREENTCYVVTVPKRGYKLVAQVTPLEHEQVKRSLQSADVASSVSQVAEAPLLDEPRQEVAFPAAPLTRAVSYFSGSTSKSTTTPEFKRWKTVLMDVLWVSVLIIAVAIFTHKQSETRITQALDTQLIEFSFLPSMSGNVANNELADGISQKLMSDLTRLSDYRVKLSKAVFSSGILPGKQVTVRVEEHADQPYLAVEYQNRASNNVLFSRQYSLNDRQLKAVLRNASFDLMEALRVAVTAEQVDALQIGLPQQSEALALFIRANHYLNLAEPDKFSRGIDLLEQVSQIELNNSYVQAELFIAYHALNALSPKRQANLEKAHYLGQKLTVQPQVGEKVQPRVYEALALSETLKGNNFAASDYLHRALSMRQSVLSFILQGKQAELSGELELASEAYSQAFYIDTSLETYKLCENLAFNSNLKSIDYAMYRAVHPSVVRLL